MDIRENLKVEELLDKVEVVGERNGTKLVSASDYSTIVQAEMLYNRDKSVTDNYKLNPNGTIKGITSEYAIIDIDAFYDNRYEVETEGNKKVIVVVTDNLAIKGKARGLVYARQVVGYVFKRDKTDLILDKIKMVDQDEFIKKFNNKLGKDDMKLIKKLIYDKTTDELEVSKMPI